MRNILQKLFLILKVQKFQESFASTVSTLRCFRMITSLFYFTAFGFQVFIYSPKSFALTDEEKEEIREACKGRSKKSTSYADCEAAEKRKLESENPDTGDEETDKKLAKSGKECAEEEKNSANSCNEDTSKFAQSAMQMLQMLMMAMMMKQQQDAQGTQGDCQNIANAQAGASAQMGAQVGSCGMIQMMMNMMNPQGQQQQQNGQQQNGQQQQSNQQNMASDCKSKSNSCSNKCAKAKKDAESASEKDCENTDDPDQCKAGAKKAAKNAEEGSKHCGRMGGGDGSGMGNMAAILGSMAQMMCQMQQAKQCVQETCASPGQMKYDPNNTAMTRLVGKGKVIVDGQGCMVDCNNVSETFKDGKPNPDYMKNKMECECARTPNSPNCAQGSQIATNQTPPERKKKASQSLTSDETEGIKPGDRTAALGIPGDGPKKGGGLSGGGNGLGGGAGTKGPNIDKKDSKLGGLPPLPPAPNSTLAGMEAGSLGSKPKEKQDLIEKIGKYSKFLPKGGRVPAGNKWARIGGAQGRSIWEKINDAYKGKSHTFIR